MLFTMPESTRNNHKTEFKKIKYFGHYEYFGTILTLLLTTRFPEAIPLRKVTAPVIASAPLRCFMCTCLPGETQSDRDANYEQVAPVLAVLDILHTRSAAFHPESLAQ